MPGEAANKPVRIVFGERAERTDLITDAKLPNYTAAVQGSFQFFRCFIIHFLHKINIR